MGAPLTVVIAQDVDFWHALPFLFSRGTVAICLTATRPIAPILHIGLQACGAHILWLPRVLWG